MGYFYLNSYLWIHFYSVVIAFSRTLTSYHMFTYFVFVVCCKSRSNSDCTALNGLMIVSNEW
jgi:hypothetical protein